MGGTGHPNCIKQFPPGAGIENRLDRHEAHGRMSVPGQDDLITRLGSPYQIS
jgi:hypothetical protein